jgi:hypothetical protein
VFFRVHIHESANVQATEAFWLRVTGADQSQFHRTLLKRHNPKTVRKNVGNEYHGCLRVDVRRGTSLYHRIEGWCLAAMNEAAETSAD